MVYTRIQSPGPKSAKNHPKNTPKVDIHSQFVNHASLELQNVHNILVVNIIVVKTVLF